MATESDSASNAAPAELYEDSSDAGSIDNDTESITADPATALLWGDEKFSDVILTISVSDDSTTPQSETPPENTRKRKQPSVESQLEVEDEGKPNIAAPAAEPEPLLPGCTVLHLHAAVLIMYSAMLRAKLLRYAGAARPFRMRIALSDAAEASAFEAMLWTLYHGALPPGNDNGGGGGGGDGGGGSGMSAHGALAIAQVARAYGADRALIAAANWLDAHRCQPSRDNDSDSDGGGGGGGGAWDDALALFAAPPAVRQCLSAETRRAALRALLARVGDLELVLNGSEGGAARAALAALPEDALIALLSADELAVAAESTVAAAALLWARAHRLNAVPNGVAGCVRLKALRPEFAAGVTCAFPQWSARVFALLMTCESCEALGACGHLAHANDEVRDHLNGRARTASVVRSARFRAIVPLDDVAAAFGRCMETGVVQDIRAAAVGVTEYAGLRSQGVQQQRTLCAAAAAADTPCASGTRTKPRSTVATNPVRNCCAILLLRLPLCARLTLFARLRAPPLAGRYHWYATVRVFTGKAAAAARYDIGIFVGQRVHGAEDCTRGYVARTITITSVGKEERDDKEVKLLRSFTSVRSLYGLPKGIAVDLENWNADDFAKWVDDNGNLNFDVEVVVP
ncbi:hypothetical protein JKP88DRAFT_249737 [Tribonema minus]|uniref:BACK domain-containing protein n=1 Tax=Tribonema minus TaxID=303371 RepID=A0A836C805_9STRA|nr:hypothetical protein JKP88DRAFT_249737 [Tribonema minus]